MAKVLVSLVSDQTIPNVMLINELKHDIDEYIFLTTREMEKSGLSRSSWTIDAAGIPDIVCTKKHVEPNSIDSVLLALDKLIKGPNKNYIVNITAGTKLMAIACMNYFAEMPNCKIIYSFINSNSYRQISPGIDLPETIYNKKLTLLQYLKAYGLEAEITSRKPRNINLASNLFKECIKYKNNLNKLPKIKYAHSYKNPIDKVFFSGGWFEEYIFQTIKSKLKLSSDEISFNVKIRGKNTSNEYDVVFVYKHRIHIVECKAYFGRNAIKQKIENALYKQGALDDDIGINAKSYFITNFNMFDHSKLSSIFLSNRAKDLGVSFIQMKNLEQNKFVNLIK